MLTVTTPAQTGDLTVLDTLKAELQVTGTDDDAYLSDIIRQASDAIAAYCGRTTFGRETVEQTERLTSRRKVIVLGRDIAPTVTEVTENGATLATTDWVLNGSLLYRLSSDAISTWSAAKVVITYSSGFTLLTGLPFDLERVCLDYCRLIYASRGRDPALRSEKILDVIDTSFVDPDKLRGTSGLPADIEARLGVYRLLVRG